VSEEDLQERQARDERRAAERALLARMRAAFEDVPPEQLEREVTAVIEQVRAEAREERAQRDSA
jgi:hypothetical protein